LNSPYDVALDAAGNLYISDSGNNVIREVASDSQIISTVAGNGTNGFSGDGGPATSAELSGPWDIAADAQGNIYIADTGNYRVRAVGSSVTEPNTTLPTISWSNPASVAYGTALSGSQLNATASVPGTLTYTPVLGTVLPAGLQALSVLFTPNDTAHYSPVMATVPLTVTTGTSIVTWGAPAPILYGTALSALQLNASANVPGSFTYTPAIGSVLAPGQQTLSVTFTPSDVVDYSPAVATVDLTVLGMPGSGDITTIAGDGYYGNSGDGGLAINAELEAPEQIAVDSAGNVYIPDSYAGVVRKVAASTGIITTIAGTGSQGYSGDGGQATTAQLNSPMTVALDSSGNIYIADYQNNRIRKITVATGVVTTIAGTGTAGYSGDGGAATRAEITSPLGIAFDGAGNLYIADTGNAVVRKVTVSSGIISTVAGNHLFGYSGDGGPATSATFSEPGSIAFDSSGNFYIADLGDNVVRKVTASTGVISTVAGNGTAGYTGDGGPAATAELNVPVAVAIDSTGNIFIIEYGNFVVRLVSVATGNISTVVGNGSSGYSGDGGPASSAQLSYPYGIAFDSAGNLYIGDCGNHRVRLVGGTSQAGVSVSVSPSAATLYAQQTKQFSATVTNTSNSAVTWSITPAGAGSITSSGLYTAPSTINAQQTVTVTAMSQADSSVAASATVTLTPTIAVSVTPGTASLYGGQVQSFSATVTNASNAAVSWSITPSGLGSIDSSGNYNAPPTVATPQLVTVRATSQMDSTKSATSTVYLLPPCVSNGYTYVRAIVIDHAKVPNTDQSNFPFLFSTTDPAFKTMANGGHVTNSSGYDIIFTSDPAGMNVLPFEQASYGSSTGSVSYWVNVPQVSHIQDSQIYVWYGNSNITTSQANVAQTWGNGYLVVAHLQDTSNLVNSVTGLPMTNHGATSAAGGGVSFGGSAQYIDTGFSMGTTALPLTVDVWFNHSSGGGNPGGTVGTYTGGGGFAGPQIYGSTLRSFVFDASGNYTYRAGTTSLSNSVWYKSTMVAAGPATISQYLDGVGEGVSGSANNTSGLGTSAQNVYIGVDYVPGGEYWSGAIKELRISNVARSADWIATEYNNETSPSTFYSLKPEATLLVSPLTANLYPSQYQQFIVSGACQSPAIWSMPAGSPGVLSGDGLYTAPNGISAPQTVTITATSSTDSTRTGTAVVTLLPTPEQPKLILSASVPPPYVTGATQQFIAALKDRDGNPISGVNVSFAVSGVNGATSSAVTDSNGNAILTYAGTNSGVDSIQSTAIGDGVQLTSNTVSVTWIVPSQTISSTTITGEFFVADPSASTFYITPDMKPAFVQSFPTINFNPPSGTIPGNTSGVDVNSRPFTDVTTDLNGHFTGTIVAQGNGYQAGVSNTTGNMVSFQAVFQGAFTIAAAGNVQFNFYNDDGFIVGIGNGATRVSGDVINMPPQTPIRNYPTLGAYNDQTGPSGHQVVVNFPSPGTYPFEIDYFECCNGPLALTVTQGATSAIGVTPTGSLTLSPSSVQAMPIGSQLQPPLTVLASDAAGNPISNAAVSLVICCTNTQELSATTDASGHATFNYTDSSPGTDTVQAISFIDGMVTYSNQVTIPWTLPSSTSSGSGSSGTLSVSVDAPNTIILPNMLQLGGSASDSSLPQGDSITTTWSKVSGPGAVTFANPQQISTTASFSEPGSYILQLAASDVNGNTSAQLTVAVDPEPGQTQGWIGSPTYGSQVSCILPITVAAGESLTGGVLSYYPANDPNNVTVLNPNTTGSGQIGTFDTTVLNNGTYWITLQATDTSGSSEYNVDLVTVVGNCKPGRVTSTVTDLVVPAKGLAIDIQRTYDTLNASMVGDFGYGWNLSTNVNLTVDPKGDVSFTLGGIRHTFYLTPVFNGFLPFYTPAYTSDPGFHGTLSGNGPGCSDLFDFILPDGSLWYCVDGGLYSPSGYVYTDPNGTQYLMGANGNLQLIQDKNGNALTITANGITSSTGLSVPFVRDTTGRITEITDPQGNHYQYSYDGDGNLASVTYPNISQASTYTYDTHHRYLSGTDFRGNALPTTDYYGPSDTDPNGLPLNGRLKSVTNALGQTTGYAYNLSTNTTTITYPPDGSGNPGAATMVYDTLGDLLVSTDPLGHITTNTYDLNQNLMSTTDPLGHVTRYTYDTNGNKTSTTYPTTATSTNTTSTTTYNQYSEPTQTADELGNTRSFNYDVDFNPQSVTDGLGTLASFAFNTDGTMQSGAVGYDIGSQPSMGSQFTYDTNGNLAARTDALGRTTSYTYDSLGHKLTTTEPLPNSNTSAAAATTTYTYDDFGNVTQTSAPLSRVTSSTYDGNGNKISDTDARGNTTTYQYDALNRLTLTTYPDTTTASKTYDFRGNLVTETDQAGHVTKHVYDLAGRETSVTHAYGTSNATTTSYTYDNAGRKLTETDALGHTTTYSYDSAGNLASVSGVGGSFTYAYDNARNRVSMTDGNGHTTGYVYDARKRLVETDYPDGTKKTNAYDGPGNLVSVTDQADNVVEYTYDAANQLKNVVQASSPNSGANTTIVGYDANSNPIVLQDANLHVTASSFDLANELTAKTLPDSTLTESRNYDPAGNLLSVTHFNGVTTTYTYDTLNRLLSRATPGETTVSFTYTATGKRHTMTDASGTTTYGYDAMDRLTSKAAPEGTLTYTYDSAGNLATMASNHTNGVSVSYTYDSLNRLLTVVDNRLASGANTTTYTYDDASNVATVTYPNGVQSTFTYDDLNRVTGLSSQLGNYTYQLGPAGNRNSASEPSGRSVTWSYDGIYRLTNEAITGAPSGKNGTVAYGLDPVGNRTSASSSISSLAPVSGTFNPDDELSSETYDQNGNVLSEGGKTFTYDAENHLMSTGSTVGLMYDGDGNRVAKSVSGVTTYYLVDDLNPTGYPQVVEELNSSGAVTRQYSYGLQRISQQQAISNTWTPSFYGYDGGGSVRALTNSAGAVTDTYEYDGFGNQISSTGSTPNSYLYRGEYLDSDLGLYYLRARYYNPLTGRFMSRDPNEPGLFGSNYYPVDPKSLHKYLYAGGDPIDAFDPSGRVTVTKPKEGLGGAIGEYASILQDISLRSLFVVQVAIPVYLKSPDFPKHLYVLVSGGVLAIGVTCEVMEVINGFNQIFNDIQGTNVHAPLPSCLDGVDSGAGDTGSQ
jgi:RHS repeat-associated protein